jgi:hypothetical protein
MSAVPRRAPVSWSYREGCQYGRIASRRAACQSYAEAKSKSAYDVAGWHSFGRQLTAGIYGAAIGIDHQTRRKGARGVMSQHISINVVR